MNLGVKNKADLMLALLYAGDSSKIEGITRLEKLLFLLKKEKGFLSNAAPQDDFNFYPFRMGPWTNEVYDEVDFLESLGLLTKEKESKETPADTASQDELFSNLLLDKYQKTNFIHSEKGTDVFGLTDNGRQKALAIWNKLSDVEKRDIIELKRNFNKMDLKKFLRYVYLKFPEYASESEIKDSLGL